MSAQTLYTNLQLELRQTPDVSIDKDGNGQTVANTLPGFIEIGTVVQGVWVPLLRRKAAGFLADVERVKAAVAAETPPPPPPAPSV